MGGKLWADTSIALNHIGKHDYNLYNARVESRANGQSSPADVPPPAGFDLEKK